MLQHRKTLVVNQQPWLGCNDNNVFKIFYIERNINIVTSCPNQRSNSHEIKHKKFYMKLGCEYIIANLYEKNVLSHQHTMVNLMLIYCTIVEMSNNCNWTIKL
jgi:hypothetical protein